MKPPCGKVCPKRSAECKKTCEEWAEYEAEKFERYREKEKRILQAEDYYNYLAHRVRKNRKH